MGDFLCIPSFIPAILHWLTVCCRVPVSNSHTFLSETTPFCSKRAISMFVAKTTAGKDSTALQLLSTIGLTDYYTSNSILLDPIQLYNSIPLSLLSTA